MMHRFLKNGALAVALAALLPLGVLACKSSAPAAPAAGTTVAPTAATSTTPAPAGGPNAGATAAPTARAATPAGAAASSGGLPFGAGNFKSGDWAKYSMMMGTMTQKTVEVSFGGATYEGNESTVELTGIPGMPAIPSVPGAPAMPGMPTGLSVSIYLAEKGKPAGKAWVVTKTGATVQCFSPGVSGQMAQVTPAPRDPNQVVRPDMTLLGTDTYKVPETGQTIKVWKYRTRVTTQGMTAEQEMWVSNEVPTYSVKMTGDNPMAPGSAITMMELLGFGSGAPISITRAELEANCK